MEKYKIAFLGGIYPDDIREIQKDSKVSLDYAADVYQKKYINCINKIENVDFTIFSAMFLGSWPINSKQMKIEYRENFKYNNIYIDYINVLGIRNISKVNSCIKYVSTWIIKNKDTKNLKLFVYSAGFSKEIIFLKKRYPYLKIYLILPDLPKFTYLSTNNILRKCIINYRQKLFERSCKYLEECICITEEMKKYVEKYSKTKCRVIEGIADRERCESNLKRLENIIEKDEKIIFYSGTLAKKYGIIELLDTFKVYKRKNCKLIICGDGDAKSYLLKLCKIDNRIKYMGILPNNEVKEIQDKADVLINPRKPYEEYTTFSFPSKTMEYLESGNLVISYKLAGIPKEYNNYLFIPNNLTTEALINCFDKCLNLNLEERKKIGKRNLNFLLNNKCGESIKNIIF